MSIALTVTSLHASHGNHNGLAAFTLTFTAAAYTTGGIVADITKIIPESERFVGLKALTGSSSLGHSVNYVAGATPALAKFQLFNGTTEVANATSLTLVLTLVAIFGGGVNSKVSGLVVG